VSSFRNSRSHLRAAPVQSARALILKAGSCGLHQPLQHVVGFGPAGAAARGCLDHLQAGFRLSPSRSAFLFQPLQSDPIRAQSSNKDGRVRRVQYLARFIRLSTCSGLDGRSIQSVAFRRRARFPVGMASNGCVFPFRGAPFFSPRPLGKKKLNFIAVTPSDAGGPELLATAPDRKILAS